jgi:hypothetical protein
MSDEPASSPPAQAAEPGRLQGRLERADRKVIAGWARDEARPGERVELEVLIDDESAGTLIARSLRPDLAKAGVGDGAHAFWLYLPQGLSPLAGHTVRVRRRGDGAELPGSPMTVPPEEEPVQPAREMIARAGGRRRQRQPGRARPPDYVRRQCGRVAADRSRDAAAGAAGRAGRALDGSRSRAGRAGDASARAAHR